MKEIYKANKDITVSLIITNNNEVNSIVYLNGIEYDNVVLAKGEKNTRVLEIELKEDDIISVNENDLINYMVK